MSTSAVNKQLFTHYTRHSTKDFPFRHPAHPKQTKTLSVTHTRQGLAGGKWIQAKPEPYSGYRTPTIPNGNAGVRKGGGRKKIGG